MSEDEQNEEDLIVHEGDLIFKTLVRAVNKVDSDIDVKLELVTLTTPRDMGFVGYANGQFVRGGGA